MACDPYKNDEIWKRAIEKETMVWQSPEALRKTMRGSLPAPSHTSEMYYRVPMPGEHVIVTGIQRRPELNGARGEVVSGELDEFGRVTVRVFDSTVPGAAAGSRRMKIQPARLVPSASAPSMHMLVASAGFDDRSSVRSCSRASGSVASPSGRASAVSSVLSATARSALLSKVKPCPGAPGSTPFVRSASSGALSAVSRH
mmetsp:Transcript_13172/g.37923  ORF Transcript_13172/g.37923 Transcript_13172/m.37923 type:complete len:200 (-) Transcript_13172:192-791(-)